LETIYAICFSHLADAFNLIGQVFEIELRKLPRAQQMRSETLAR